MEATDGFTATDLAELLQELVDVHTDARSLSFDDAGVLTRNSGLVVRTADGREFQVAVVRSR